MRFLAKGPSIPDELLNARDQGRVVFFCGAGISKATACLPTFFELTKTVIDKLGVPFDGSARRRLELASEFSAQNGEKSQIAFDQIFELLEHDFWLRDIEIAVAQALKPPLNVDLSAHRSLLHLATTREGKTRLVTTNFDRLFQASDEGLVTLNQPKLPTFSQPEELDGIVHLHGIVNSNYSGAENGGLILSSSDFGRAYLAEGWATEFFRQVLRRYIVVFVGYTANDPPVRYLMEGLHKQSGNLEGVYAFQSGDEREGFSTWQNKGVQVINYSDFDMHRALWDTLVKWGERAQEPDRWFESTIALAKEGPERLKPHERGMVAHIVSTHDGMRKFSESNPPPPSEWLCAFDPFRRYARPGYRFQFGQEGASEYFDPFDAYGLDSDIVPPKIAPDDHLEKREPPPNSWDVFSLNQLDHKNLRDNNLPAFRGIGVEKTPRLPARLQQLGVWVTRISHQPACVWWAAHQGGLHQDLQNQISLHLKKTTSVATPIIRKAWHYLFDAEPAHPHDYYQSWYDLKDLIKKDGWNSLCVRKFSYINRPILTFEQSYYGPKPPELREDSNLNVMVRLDVSYPNVGYEANLPPEWIVLAVREFRKNLELAVLLETEIGGFGLDRISPIVADPNPTIDSYSQSEGLSGAVKYFSTIFDKLVELDLASARQEFSAWPVDNQNVFAMLRIWAIGNKTLFSTQDFLEHISCLSDLAFWKMSHQRDLLLVLAKRWNSLEASMKNTIEKRLIDGPNISDQEDTQQNRTYKARVSLDRICWMKEQGCEFTFDFEATIQTLKTSAPEWEPESAASAAESIVDPRGGIIQTITEYSALQDLPPKDIIPTANELSGRGDSFLERNDPFAGLCENKPLLAFRALKAAAKNGEFPEWAWRTFFQSKATVNNLPRFAALVVGRLLEYPNEALAEFVHSISIWLLVIGKELSSKFPILLDKIISKLIDILERQPATGNSGIFRGNRDPDWEFEAINSPVGNIVETLMMDPRITGELREEEFPSDWLSHANRLLCLPGDLRRYVLVIVSRNLNWFYQKTPDWSKTNIISILRQDDLENRIAVWSGLLGSRQNLSPTFYRAIKPYILDASKDQDLKRNNKIGRLASLVWLGWISIQEDTQERYITNAELRDVLIRAGDEFCSSFLWHLGKGSEQEDNQTDYFEELLRNVWPRQKFVSTPRVSGRLIDLAIESPERFPGRADLILPFLTQMNKGNWFYSHFWHPDKSLIEKFPEKVLAILYAVLPKDADNWSYGVSEVIEEIGKADTSLKNDERLIELYRRWDSR